MESVSIQIERILTEENTEIMSVRWNQDDSMIAIGCSDGYIKVYSDVGLVRALHCQKSGESMPVTSIRWKPPTGKTKNVLLATTCDGGIFQFHASTGRLMFSEVLENNQTLSCEYKPDASAFAVGCKDTAVRIYDEQSKVVITQLGPSLGYGPGHNSRVYALKWVDENMLVSGGWDNKIVIWDMRTNDIAREFFGPHICGDSLDVSGNTLLTGSYHSINQIQLWDIAEGKNIYSQTLRSSDNECLVYTAQFSKVDKMFAVGGSGSDEAYFYNFEPVTPLAVMANMTKPVYSIDFCNLTSRAAVGCGDGSTVICRIKKN
ncbi:hypothetical protein SteCoe_15740 [Stentor coeruleus]|uniref:Anaphase-promoting complex subunit 4-like WD40 domain-containing protein n=1 Tax=Stentor coeruleus TaxID=5963 RepID=A0A1R2C2Z7_9CILI|nr:hypothetical protein SteCoe_15740 [Stentor coeruleus]